MTHEEAKCTKVEDTKLEFDRISHMYECPICKKQHRFADPKEDEYVFCIGSDFGLFTPDTNLESDEFTDYEILPD